MTNTIWHTHGHSSGFRKTHLLSSAPPDTGPPVPTIPLPAYKSLCVRSEHQRWLVREQTGCPFRAESYCIHCLIGPDIQNKFQVTSTLLAACLHPRDPPPTIWLLTLFQPKLEGTMVPSLLLPANAGLASQRRRKWSKRKSSQPWPPHLPPYLLPWIKKDSTGSPLPLTFITFRQFPFRKL